MSGDFAGKVAIVTGGASGVGRAVALNLAGRDARVVVADVQSEEGEKTARMVEDLGKEAVFLRVDVSKSDEVASLVAETVARFGRLDVAVNDAAIEGERAKTVDCTEESWDRILAVNLKGVFLCMKHEISQMLKQGGGSVVNVSSSSGLVGFPTMPAYAASKHGVLGLTRSAAVEYARSGIRVNAVCPGGIDTPMLGRVVGGREHLKDRLLSAHPIGRLARPEEIAAAICWLACDAASFIVGHALSVDGGLVAI